MGIPSNLHSLLCCPLCHGALSFGEKEIVCNSCGEGYSWIEGKPNLMAGSSRRKMDELYQTGESSRITHQMADRVGSYSPRLTRLLRGLAHLLSPPDPWYNYSRKKIKHTLIPSGNHRLILDVGCGLIPGTSSRNGRSRIVGQSNPTKPMIPRSKKVELERTEKIRSRF